MDSESDEEDQVIKATKVLKNAPVVDQFPALFSTSKVAAKPAQQVASVSYAGITAKPKEDKYEPKESNYFLKPAKQTQKVVPIPKLERSQASGTNVITPATNGFWDNWDSENEDERAYAATQLEMEEHKKKLFNLNASSIDWACESDDEDW